MWVRGLKHCVFGLHLIDDDVAPHVGAWIETPLMTMFKRALQSHPMWVRGLKLLQNVNNKRAKNVAPHVGAWIETQYHNFY